MTVFIFGLKMVWELGATLERSCFCCYLRLSFKNPCYTWFYWACSKMECFSGLLNVFCMLLWGFSGKYLVRYFPINSYHISRFNTIKCRQHMPPWWYVMMDGMSLVLFWEGKTLEGMFNMFFTLMSIFIHNKDEIH